MLDALCLRQHKTLPSKIEKIILEKKRADGQSATYSPLWLSLAVNMLMAIDHDDFEKMSQLEGRGDQQIESYLVAMANGFDPLPGPLFLSLKNKAGVLFGETFTKAVFEYIAISRNGLREKDLENLLPAGTIAWDPLRFANLRRWFKAHLVLQGEELQWNLAHSILRIILTNKLEEAKIIEIHSSIASYLVNLSNDTLKEGEAMYHLMCSGRHLDSVHYYSGKLTQEESIGASAALAEILIADNGLSIVGSLPGLVVDIDEEFLDILSKYIIELDGVLKLQGNLDIRIKLLEQIKLILDNSYGDKIQSIKFGYYKSMLIMRLGLLYKDTGQLNEAIKCFESSYRLAIEINDTFPSDRNIKKSIYYSLANLADVYREMKHTDKALSYLSKSMDLFKEINVFNPNEKTLREQNGINQNNEQTLVHQMFPEEFLATLYLKYGEIQFSMGHLKESLTFFNHYYEIIKNLSESYPSSESYKESLVIAYSKFGQVSENAVLFDEALNYYNKAHYITNELYESNPTSFSYQIKLAKSYGLIGKLNYETGKYAGACKSSQKSILLFKELIETNPSFVELKSDLAEAISNLGRAQMEMGQLKEALKNQIKGNQIAKENCDKDPTNISYRNNLAISFERLGDIYKAFDQLKESFDCYNQRFSIAKELYEANPNDEALKDGYAYSCSKLAIILFKMGKNEDALIYFESFQRVMQQLYDNNSDNIKFVEGLFASHFNLSQIYRELNRNSEGLHNYNLSKNFVKILLKNRPSIEKYRNWDKWEFDSSTQNKTYSYPTQTDSNNEYSYPIQTDTNTDDVLTDEQRLINNLIQNNNYGEALEMLKNQEESLRKKNYKPFEFQNNTGEQAFVLSKLGRYKEALQKYELQSELCGIYKINENYVGSLISQAEILIKHLNKPKQAKDLLLEAIAVAEENKLNQMVHEAEKMLKEIK